jgi:hypothetical protein
VTEWNDSVLSLFVEKCGGNCALTAMTVLFGEATGRADSVRERWQGTLGALFPETATTAAR